MQGPDTIQILMRMPLVPRPAATCLMTLPAHQALGSLFNDNLILRGEHEVYLG